MGKVTAVKMDCITDKSGHNMTGMAVSVCTTPAAPSPLPIPYPTAGSVGEGVIDECMRTKIDGGKVVTVGSCMKACHGNEPGTLKEVVSLNTGGPSFPTLGAPTVIIELGMAGITGSLGQMNKAITVGGPSSASGAGGGAGGGGGGGGGAGGPSGGGPQGPSGGGGGGGGSNAGAAPPSPPAPPTAEGQASGGHPVDVVTGAMYTLPAIDFWLTGFLTARMERSYSTAAVGHQCGIGWGWSHDFAWSAQLAPGGVEIVAPGGRVSQAPLPAADEVAVLPFGVRLSRRGDDLIIAAGDGVYRTLRRATPRTSWQLVELGDDFGNVIELVWDQAALVEIVDSVGRRARLHREDSLLAWEVAVTDAEGRTHSRRAVIYELDDAGDLVRVVDAGGAEIVYGYDADHYLVSETLPDGMVFHFRYEVVDGVRRCVETWGEHRQRDALALVGADGPAWARGVYHTRFNYQPARRRTVVTDGTGAVHTYRGNALGLVEEYTDPCGYARSYRYNALGKLLGVRDGGGRTSRRVFDALGRRVVLTERGGATWRDQIDEETSRISRTLPDGRQEHWLYAGGAVTEHVDASGRKTQRSYDAKGRLAAFVRPSGATSTHEYDAHGNISKTTLPNGSTCEYTFDLLGCPVRIKTAPGVELTLGWDSRGDLVQLEDSSGRRTEIAIDASRRVTARRDVHGTTSFTYAAGALVETVEADGRRWLLAYDAVLRLRSIVNPAGERYVREYDGAGNIVRETSFAGITTGYEYDGSGEVVRVTRPDGTWTRLERDGDGRVVGAEHSSGASERYQYDVWGRLTHAHNGQVFVRFDRDAAGRVVREVQEAGGWQYAVMRDFDADGQVVARRYSTGWSVATERRVEDGAVVSLRASNATAETAALAFEYDGRGEEVARRRLDRPGAIVWERGLGRVPERISILGEGDRVLRERGYAWSALGPVEAIDDSRHGTRRYTLDPMGRPLALEGLGAEEQFTFAPAGTAVPARDEAWSLGRGGRPVATAGGALAWDARGRLSERRAADPRKSWVYRYDDRDRLVELTRGDGLRIRYLYDALGRRIGETHDDGSSVWFGWDGDSAVEERPSVGGAVRRVWADDGYSPLLEDSGGDAWTMVVTDAAATPWSYLGADLALVDVDLGAWGRVVRSSGDPGSLRFAGQRADALSGLHYNRHRFFDPDLHVFLTPDPLGMLGSLQDIGFVPNVTFFIDPLGLTTIINGAPGDAAVAAAVSTTQQNHPGATVIPQNALTAGSLTNENHVIVVTHGEPGEVQFGPQWGQGNLNGPALGQTLSNAGFQGGAGSQVDVMACNSATPAQGNTPSVAQGVANTTGATTGGAASANPAATYAGTTAPGPGGHQWGPGMTAPVQGNTQPYVHQGQWTQTAPAPAPATGGGGTGGASGGTGGAGGGAGGGTSGNP